MATTIVTMNMYDALCEVYSLACSQVPTAVLETLACSRVPTDIKEDQPAGEWIVVSDKKSKSKDKRHSQTTIPSCRIELDRCSQTVTCICCKKNTPYVSIADLCNSCASLESCPDCGMWNGGGICKECRYMNDGF